MIQTLDVMRIGVVMVLYIATAKAGLALDALHGFAAVVWPPAGIALAALLLYGRRLWPGITLGAFLVNWSAGASVAVAVGIALGNTLEALVATFLLGKIVRFRPALDRLRDALALLLCGAGLSPLLSATIGVSSGWFGQLIPTADYGKAWYTWWLGDALGILTIAPLFLVWSKAGRISLTRRRCLEMFVLVGSGGALSLFFFSQAMGYPPLPVLYLLFPPLIWTAVRLGPQGAVTATTLVALCAIWGTVQGLGPFAEPSLYERLFQLQLFMSVISGTILILAAVTAERRQAEATAYEQRERLHVTLTGIGDAVMATDAQGRVTFLNPVAAALTGWPAAEAVGKDMMEVMHLVNEYTRQPVENPVIRVLREGKVVGLANHTLLINRAGLAVPIDDSGAPIYDSQGNLLGAVLVFRDIQERRQAEELQGRLAALVESSEHAMIGKTLEGIITSWNQGAERLYGYEAAEVLGKSIALIIPSDRPQELQDILRRLRQGEAIRQYETERVRRDGRHIPVSLTISPIRTRGGHIFGASVISQDISMQKQTMAEMERRRQETALLAEIAQSLNASLDLDTVLRRVVSGTQELCRCERAFLALREPGSATMVGRYEVGTLQPSYSALHITPGQGLGGQVLLTGKPWRTSDYAADPRFSKAYFVETRDEGHLAVLAVPILLDRRIEGLLYASNRAAHPFTDHDEAILVRLATHAALAIHNAQLYQQAQAELMERQKAEMALAQAAAELEQRVQERTVALQQEMLERQRLEREAQRVQHFTLLGRLAAGVSHEIRNPLAAVFLQVDLLEEELLDPSADSATVVPEAFAAIKTNLKRLEDLVQDYLTLVRVNNVQRDVQDLGTALQTWGNEMQQEIQAHSITIVQRGLEQLGMVAFHASTLRRALLNLVQNAADAMPQGGTIILGGEKTATHVQVCVQDTGSGMSAAQLEQIFEPLYTTKPGGTGLGLYIVQEIVAAHDGHITVKSTPGQGSTFLITLPRTVELPSSQKEVSGAREIVARENPTSARPLRLLQ